jgi:hypothetical protein
MNLSGSLTLIGAGLVVATAGILYPLQSKVSAASSAVDTLDGELSANADVHGQLLAAHAAMIAVQKRIQDRAVILCPDTPEAIHEFESSVLDEVDRCGLHSVRMDRHAESQDLMAPSFSTDLVVEGDASALHTFLEALESLRWVSRVMSISIDPGNEVRRVSLQIAVMLEQKS